MASMSSMDSIPLTEEHLTRYLASLSEDQQKQAGRYAKMFFYHSKDGSRKALEEFFGSLQSRYKDSTIRYIWGVIHRFYVINKLDWPYRTSETPTIRERTVFAPILDADIIKEMIVAAKNGMLTSKQSFYLAISTTYGCRRVELAQLSKADIDLSDRLIYIATKKLGRERYHIIPEPIVPYVGNFLSRLKPTNTKALDRTFRRIEEVISFPHVTDLGWHSIRRSLNRQLLDAGLQEHIVMDYLRWKRSDRNMPMRYARGTIIGRETKGEDMALQDKKTDETVFSVHPFLQCWS